MKVYFSQIRQFYQSTFDYLYIDTNTYDGNNGVVFWQCGATHLEMVNLQFFYCEEFEAMVVEYSGNFEFDLPESISIHTFISESHLVVPKAIEIDNLIIAEWAIFMHGFKGSLTCPDVLMLYGNYDIETSIDTFFITFFTLIFVCQIRSKITR